MKNFILLLLALAFSMPVFGQNDGGFTPDQLLKLEEIFKPARAKIEAQLRKSDSKKFEAMMVSFNKLAEIADADERQKAAADLQATHADFFKKGYAKAGINESDFQKSVLDLFKGTGFKIKFGLFLTFTATKPQPPASPGSNDGSCTQFHCPFKVRNEETPTEGHGHGNGSFEDYGGAGCRLSSSSDVEIGGRCDQWMAAGEYITIPAGTGRVEVSAPVQKFLLTGHPYTVLGSSYAYANCGIYVSGNGVEHKFIYNESAAYAAFFFVEQGFRIEGTGQNFRTEFVPDAGGGEYKVQLFVSTIVWSVLGHAHSNSIIADPKHLQVCLFKK